jgi:hypothetical protein
MQRWASAAFALVVLTAVAVVVLNVDPTRPNPSTAPSAAPSASREAPTTPRVAVSVEQAPNQGPEAATSAKADRTPPLPANAPDSVRIGIIQFAYEGAERAPKGAPPKAQALERAKSVLPAALEDFEKAVDEGGAGSGADLGRVPRGVLEPEVQYVVFTLDPGEVAAEPLDTPRGYWIVRRND